MTKTLRVGLAQINTTVGDLEGNVRKALEYVDRARELGVDVVSFPELTVTGYPPEDLLLRARFVKDNVEALHSMVERCRGIAAVVGFADLRWKRHLQRRGGDPRRQVGRTSITSNGCRTTACSTRSATSRGR